MGKNEDNSLKEVLETRKRFLVDNESENGRHRVYNFVMDTLDPKSLLEKLDVMFDSLKSAAKLNVAFGFVLKNVDDWICRTRKNKPLKMSERVATKEDLTTFKKLLSNTDIPESCAREGAKAKWKFSKLKYVKRFSALLN